MSKYLRVSLGKKALSTTSWRPHDADGRVEGRARQPTHSGCAPTPVRIKSRRSAVAQRPQMNMRAGVVHHLHAYINGHIGSRLL